MYPAEYADEAGVSFYNVKGRKDAEYERSCFFVSPVRKHQIM